MHHLVKLHLAVLLFTLITQFGFSASPPRYTITALPNTNGYDFRPGRINNHGEILGGIDFDEGEFDGRVHVALFRDGTLTDLHLLLPGGETNYSSFPVDLNDRGQVLFRVYTPGFSGDRFFIYDNGQFQDLNVTIGRNDLDFWAFNNEGVCVGTAESVASTARQAFVYGDGEFKLLPLLPGQPQSTATAINDRGTIVGWAGNESLPDVGYSVVFRNDTISPLHFAPSAATGINNRGDIIGRSIGGGFVRRRGGLLIRLSFVPAANNNRGHVVGDFATYPLPELAMIHSHGGTRDLNDLIDPDSGWILEHARDINDAGQIVGAGRLNNQLRSYFITPNKARAAR